MNTISEKAQKGAIELSEDFVVTYNCHKDQYKINDTVTKNWKSYASHSGKFKRINHQRNQKLDNWKVIKTDHKPQKIQWTFNLDKRYVPKTPGKFFIFVNSSTKGKGEILWTLKRDEFELQLSPRIINQILSSELFKEENNQG